jgi:hypothetical protein
MMITRFYKYYSFEKKIIIQIQHSWFIIYSPQRLHPASDATLRPLAYAKNQL